MLIYKDGIYRDIDEKYFSEYREKGYAHAEVPVPEAPQNNPGKKDSK